MAVESGSYTYEKSLDIWQCGDGECFELFKSGTESRLAEVDDRLCVVFAERRVLLGPIVSDDEVKKAIEEGHGACWWWLEWKIDLLAE